MYRENVKEYVRTVKVTVEESWLEPEEMTGQEISTNVGENVDGNQSG